MIEQRAPAVSGVVIEADGGMLSAVERRYVTATETGLTVREDLPYDVWAGLVGRLVEAEKRVHWYLADLLNFGERRYGEMYAQVLEATDYAYQTLQDARWIASRFEFSRRRENLGISIHKEVAALEPADADDLLDQYQGQGWNQKRLREAAQVRKIERAREKALAAPALPNPIAAIDVRVGDATALPWTDQAVDLIVTSPPYDLEKPYEGRADGAAWLAMLGAFAAEAYRVLTPGGRIALNVPIDVTKGGFRPVLAQSTQVLLAAGFEYATTVIWYDGTVNKSIARGSVDSPGAIRIQTPAEAIIICSKGLWKRAAAGKTTLLTHEEWLEWTSGVWRFGGESNPWEGFSAAFPLELPYRLIKLLAYREDTIADPFCGSGTTLVAAYRLGQARAVGIDADPQAVASTRRRLALAAAGTPPPP